MAKKRVLIVEDHKANADAIRDFIHFVFEDWVIEITSTGADAIKRSLATPPDVMILDIALADEINGLEVVRQLWRAGLREKPRIIFTTAMGNKAFRGPRAGKSWVEQLNEQEKQLVSGFFEKPYGWHDFLSAVAHAAGIEPPDKINLIPDNE